MGYPHVKTISEFTISEAWLRGQKPEPSSLPPEITVPITVYFGQSFYRVSVPAPYAKRFIRAITEDGSVAELVANGATVYRKLDI